MGVQSTQLHSAQSFLRNSCTYATQILRPFFAAECSSPCSQQPAPPHPPVPVLGQTVLVSTLLHCFLMTHFNIINPSMSRSCEWLLPFRQPNRNIVRISFTNWRLSHRSINPHSDLNKNSYTKSKTFLSQRRVKLIQNPGHNERGAYLFRNDRWSIQVWRHTTGQDNRLDADPEKSKGTRQKYKQVKTHYIKTSFIYLRKSFEKILQIESNTLYLILCSINFYMRHFFENVGFIKQGSWGSHGSKMAIL
jgi:hypothetical protein